jgi:quinol monooxygenase YgiN
MYTRLFYGEIQPGKAEEAWQVLRRFAQQVKQLDGCVFNQILQNGNEIVAISSWETAQHVATYSDGPVAKEFFKLITPLFMGLPTVRTYEVKLGLYDMAAMKPIS